MDTLVKSAAGRAAVPSTNTALVGAVFQTSLENLLLEATGHSTMTPLRDAVLSTRINGLSAEDVFHTFVLACDTLHGRRPCRQLLLQSLSDLGKMASLRMLPLSGTIVHVICHLMRKLLGGINMNVGGGGRSIMSHRPSSIESLGGSISQNEALPVDIDLYNASLSSGYDTGIEMQRQQQQQQQQQVVVLVDDELQLRILQTLMAYLSACELHNTALADIISLFFIMYTQSTPGSIVEASCAATIEQRTLELLRKFRSSGDACCAGEEEDGDISLTAQIQSVAYVKDVCGICSNVAPRWLKLAWNCGSLSSSTAPNQPMPNVWVAPRRLRLLLLKTLIAHFAETPPILSPHEVNIFFAQCLNEDVVSLVLGCGHNSQGSWTQQQQHQDTENHVELSCVLDECQRGEEKEDGEEFFLTQQLAVTVIVKASQVIRHTMPTLLRHHVMFLKLCNEADGGENDIQRMVAVLALWRKAIADHEVLKQLILLLLEPNSDSRLARGTTRHLQTQEQQQQQWREDAAEGRDGNDVANTMTIGYDGGMLLHPFAEFVAAAAQLLTNIITSAEGMLDLDHTRVWGEKHVNYSHVGTVTPQQKQQRLVQGEWNSSSPEGTAMATDVAQQQQQQQQQHPARGQAGDVLAFLTMFTQSLARVAERSVQGGCVAVERAATAFFASLHTPLLRCHALAGQHLRGGDVVHTLLKSTTHLVHVCCSLSLPACRDAYLHIFLSRLQTHPKQLNTGWTEEEVTSTPKRGNHPQMEASAATNVVHNALDELQQKLYVLNSVISIASSMGNDLEDGWQPVASCLLLAEPLLQGIQCIVEQQTREAVEDVAVQDVMKNADHTRDALHLLFINTAFTLPEMALEGLLTYFVSEACCQLIPSSCISSLRTVSECCSLVMLVLAEHSHAPLERLQKLWHTIKPFYLHVFSPADISQLVSASNAGRRSLSGRTMEALEETMERLVEDIAVVMVQFCRRLNSNENDKSSGNSKKGGCGRRGWKAGMEMPALWLSTGMYASAGLVVRLTQLAPLLTQVPPDAATADTPFCSSARVADDNEEKRQQLLSSPAELLAAIYTCMQQRRQQQLHHHQQQQQQQQQVVDGHDVGDGSEALLGLIGDVSLVLLKEVLKLVQGFGEELRGAAWEHLLCLLRSTATPQVVAMLTDSALLARTLPLPPTTITSPTAPATVMMVSYAKQSISLAFRALETIQHSCITSLDNEGLRQLIRCGGAFMTHSLPGTEQRLNINLSAVQLLWSIADYLVSRKQDGDRNDDILWCTLMMHLYDGCLDVRPEVRQSALKTVFSLLQTYGRRLSAECWHCVLRGVLTPLMELSIEAAGLCAIAATGTTQPGIPLPSHQHQHHGTSQQMEKRRNTSVSSPQPSPLTPSISSPFFSPSLESGPFGAVTQLLQGHEGEPGRWISRLLAHFSEHPEFFDVMRVTIMDALCRVFLSHYHVIYAALLAEGSDTQQAGDCGILLHDTLCLFIAVCASSRMVARTTTGEAAALSAVRALHALMVADDAALLMESETKVAWFAVERLLCRDDNCLSTGSKQCTAAVVATIVTSLGDVVAMQHTRNTLSHVSQQKEQERKGAWASPSFYYQLCHVLSPSTVGVDSANGETDTSHIDYFSRYIRLLEESLRSPAVTDSYFFPGRVQLAVIGVLKTLWPSLNLQERGAIIGIVMQQFPSRHMVQAFVTGALVPVSDSVDHMTKGVTAATTATSPLQHEPRNPQQQQWKAVSLQECVPPGAHPNFLLALIDFFYFVVDDGSARKEMRLQEDEFIFQLTTGVVRVAGALLLLEYAPPEVFTTPGPGVAFHAPPEFFDKTERCMQFFLADVLWGMPSTASGEQLRQSMAAARRTEGVPAALTICRREGLLSFATAFTSLVSISSTVLHAVEAKSRDFAADSNPPEHLHRALQRLERFLLLLGELIPHVIRSSGDVAPAMELLSALVPSSSVESPFFARVAGRALDLLRRWSGPSPHSLLLTRTCTACDSAAPNELKQHMLEGKSEVAADVVTTVSSPNTVELSSKLQSVVRASMGARNQAVLRRFLANPNSEETRQMAKMTLKTIILLHSPPLDENEQQRVDVEEPHTGGEEDEERVKMLQCIMLELVHLVECTGDDAELRSLLSQAMLVICAALGFPPFA